MSPSIGRPQPEQCNSWCHSDHLGHCRRNGHILRQLHHSYQCGHNNSPLQAPCTPAVAQENISRQLCKYMMCLVHYVYSKRKKIEQLPRQASGGTCIDVITHLVLQEDVPGLVNNVLNDQGPPKCRLRGGCSNQ